MRRLLLSMCLLAALPAWSEDIVDVMRRSQDTRLAAMPVADTGAAQVTIQASFDRLVAILPPGTPVIELRVVRGPVVAETLHGLIVVANQSLAAQPEPTRLFILAHELGHVMNGHWARMIKLYQKWIPGEVTQQHTDGIAALLGQDASALSRQQEFEADAFAAHLLHAMGVSQPDVLAAFMQMGPTPDTPTHPSARKRLALLREIQAGSPSP